MCAVPEQIIDVTPVIIKVSITVSNYRRVNCHKTRAYILNFTKVVAHYRYFSKRSYPCQKKWSLMAGGRKT